MTDLEQIQAIKSNTLAQMADVSTDASPPIPKAGRASAGPKHSKLQRRVDWCNQALAAERPFEIETRRGFGGMSFDPDIDDDYRQLDGLEPLALGQGNLDPLTVNNCLRETLSHATCGFSRRRDWACSPAI